MIWVYVFGEIIVGPVGQAAVTLVLVFVVPFL